MTEPEDNSISRLLALKRYERMPDGFEDQLIHELHIRQRTELMNQSLRGLVIERLHDFWESLTGPRLALAAAAIIALPVSVALLLPGGNAAHQQVAVSHHRLSDQPLPPGFEMLPPDMSTAVANFGTTPPPQEAARLSPLLLSKHFLGGYSDEVLDSMSPEFVHPRPLRQFEAMVEFGFDDELSK